MLPRVSLWLFGCAPYVFSSYLGFFDWDSDAVAIARCLLVLNLCSFLAGASIVLFEDYDEYHEKIIPHGIPDVGNNITKSQKAGGRSGKEGDDPDRLRRRLAAFYKEWRPEKLTILDKIIERYGNREEELWKRLHVKYPKSSPKFSDDGSERIVDKIAGWKKMMRKMSKTPMDTCVKMAMKNRRTRNYTMTISRISSKDTKTKKIQKPLMLMGTKSNVQKRKSAK